MANEKPYSHDKNFSSLMKEKKIPQELVDLTFFRAQVSIAESGKSPYGLLDNYGFAYKEEIKRDFEMVSLKYISIFIRNVDKQLPDVESSKKGIKMISLLVETFKDKMKPAELVNVSSDTVTITRKEDNKFHVQIEDAGRFAFTLTPEDKRVRLTYHK